MPFKSALELYSDVVLPRLAEGPKTLEPLNVPPYALKHLQAHNSGGRQDVSDRLSGRAGLVP